MEQLHSRDGLNWGEVTPTTSQSSISFSLTLASSTMVFTRNDAKLAFTHVLDTIFERPDGSSFKSSLINNGIDDIFNLITIDDTTINGLEYEDPDPNNKGTYHAVKKGDKSLIRCFIHYVVHCKNEGKPIGENWTNITTSDFDQFCCDPKYLATKLSSSNDVPKSTVPSSNSSSYKPANLFCRGIKNPSQLQTLKDDKLSDQLHVPIVHDTDSQDVIANNDVTVEKIEVDYTVCGDKLEVLDHLFTNRSAVALKMVDSEVVSLRHPPAGAKENDKNNHANSPEIVLPTKEDSETSYDDVVIALPGKGEPLKDVGILLVDGTKSSDAYCESLDAGCNERNLEMVYKRVKTTRGDAKCNDCKCQCHSIKHYFCVTSKACMCSSVKSTCPRLMWRVVKVIKQFKMRKKKVECQKIKEFTFMQ